MRNVDCGRGDDDTEGRRQNNRRVNYMLSFSVFGDANGFVELMR